MRALTLELGMPRSADHEAQAAGVAAQHDAEVALPGVATIALAPTGIVVGRQRLQLEE
jgi:hypothetical protein